MPPEMPIVNALTKIDIIDGNQAAADVAYRLNEVIAIYPITPASPMGELSDEWAAHGRPNLWGDVPTIAQMQSEAGAAGAVHGALQGGTLSTTFTASQGLLLMIPNFYKIAGELLPFVVHVAARTLATHALSIFCDHSDVMACRATGFAMLVSATPQEAHDMALVAHASTLETRVPFMHFFDGFRTSHELSKVALLSDDDIASLIDDELIVALRRRALTPDHPSLRGTAHNPDTYFQAREAVNPFYAACAETVARNLERLALRVGRSYRLFEYDGHPEAEHVIIAMGSGAVTVRERVRARAARGERVGALLVRLYRPFSASHFLAALPRTVTSVAVLDRTKEPGSLGEPLYLDVVAALVAGSAERRMPVVTGGRYGLSSKEFTPEMVDAVLENSRASAPRLRYSVGIVDDVSGESLALPARESRTEDGVFEALFWGLGSDGTVGANKNTIKIVGDETELEVQGYFVYDSKKSGAVTISHLRFSERPIAAPYLIREADLVGCHQFDFLDRYDVLARAREGGTLLVNSPYPAAEFWKRVSSEFTEEARRKRLVVHVIDAYEIARTAGLGGRINTVMQAAFFGISKIMDPERALDCMRAAFEKSYGKKGSELVRRNVAAVDAAFGRVEHVPIPENGSTIRRRPVVPPQAPDFVQRVTGAIIAGRGDALPVSAFPVDGVWPTGTSRWEKRNIALEIPVWDPTICIQCNKCALVCPHATIRAKVYDQECLSSAPATFKSTSWKGADFKGKAYTIQVAPEDCTGCRLCVEVCPAKDKANPRHKAIDMQPQRPLREMEAENFAFFLSLKDPPRSHVHLDVKGSQLLEPLFEFSGACAGCGETPYIKLMTQLFGDRLLIANATGCTSIYGGNLPTTPYTVNSQGRGPAWANSLFEDNAEFGFGLRLSVDQLETHARGLLQRLAHEIDSELVHELMNARQVGSEEIDLQRDRVERLKRQLEKLRQPAAGRLSEVADYLVKKSVWLLGGDGWAYDIGFGGLDHVLASHRKINIMVLDTEVYSNTGGQASKSTPLGAVAKFATAGKSIPKKDLGLLAMSYGHVYVASIAFGAKDAQTVRALAEAEAHPGPSLLIAYSPCVAHGYDLSQGAVQQKLAVDSGVWPLYRYDPARADRAEPPLVLDATPGKTRVRDYMMNEARFRMLEKSDKPRFETLLGAAEELALRRARFYTELARINPASKQGTGEK